MRFGRLVKEECSCSPPALAKFLASLNEKETDTPSGFLVPKTSPVLREFSKAMGNWNRHPGCPTLLIPGKHALPKKEEQN